ncbi:MAG: DUF3179 domain-containing protein [Actinomycetota bacterium]
MNRAILAVLLALILFSSACRPSTSEPADRASPRGEVLSRAGPLVDPGDVVDVLPRDGIPSIDDPRFVVPGKATWLAGREPVVALDVDGDARAYPAQIMTRHEIVNDVVGGRPVAVTYCPLCNSALVFERTVEGRILEFGVSGKLYRSALVMYDRQTESLWTHFQGRAFEGQLTGTTLEIVPAQMLSFDEWRRSYPDGRVLSRDTGYAVEYGTNPYEGYDRREGPYESFFDQAVDPRLPSMHRVVGVSPGAAAVAYPYRYLVDRGKGAGVIQDRVEGENLVVFWRAGTASAVDAADIARGRDVGATGVFSTIVGARALSFTVAGAGFRDKETGTTWSLTGLALAGPLEGARLRPLEHLDTFWFAWAAYHPDTTIHEEQ